VSAPGARPPRHPVRPMARRAVLGVLAAGSLGLVVTGDGDLLVGLALWSLVAVPLVLLGIFAARHGWDVGRFLGGGDPYEGHGPD